MKAAFAVAIPALFVGFQILSSSIANESGTSVSSWGWAIMGTRVEPVNGPVLELTGGIAESGVITGDFALANIEDGTYKPVRLVIAGEWDDGYFWPSVTLQVGDEFKGPWDTIQSNPTKPGTAILTVESGQVVTELKVSLNPFLPYVGQCVDGRVVLTSGDGAVFQLSDLKRPAM